MGKIRSIGLALLLAGCNGSAKELEQKIEAAVWYRCAPSAGDRLLSYAAHEGIRENSALYLHAVHAFNDSIARDTTPPGKRPRGAVSKGEGAMEYDLYSGRPTLLPDVDNDSTVACMPPGADPADYRWQRTRR